MNFGRADAGVFGVHVLAQPFGVGDEDLLVAVVVHDAGLGQMYSKQ